MANKNGRYVDIDPENPEPMAVCQRTGVLCMRSDLRMQYEWRGTSLQWTGFWVHKDFLANPNPQKATIILPPSPMPVDNPIIGSGWMASMNEIFPESPPNPVREQLLNNVDFNTPPSYLTKNNSIIQKEKQKIEEINEGVFE